ncbi:MAG: transcription termination/antitermination protein NusA [Clostridia bacterium]|nr:transcription termination/antitermination protein NusA [Clostridia bacterium]MBR2327942.1 transcription termination/antitermination protein NusA [Clostridia bacterium]
MNEEFFEALDALEKERGISKDYMLEKIRAAIVAAVKRERGIAGENVCADFNAEKKSVRFFIAKDIVSEVEDPITQISLEEAKAISRRNKLGGVCEINLETKNFGRIAAKIGKNVIIQAINEAMDSSVVREFEGRQNELMSGTVQRIIPGSQAVKLEVGRHELTLPLKEQIPGEVLVEGQRIKFYVVEVKAPTGEKTKGHEIVISRTHPGFVRRLFELEIPEISDGTVEIVSIAREAGSRTKIAITSTSPEVDALGACIGPRKARITNILNEINGEKIDLITYDEEVDKYVAAALSPAQVLKVDVNPDLKSCRVVVDDGQLSLAIGKEGQNARLAAKLTGWKVDIKPASAE